jgi:hypothetical protein
MAAGGGAAMRVVKARGWRMRTLSELHDELYLVVLKEFEDGSSVMAISKKHRITVQTVERLIRRALLFSE